MLFFYFFKQKTAYEMRISDWSSDVCSSDLVEQTDRDAMFTCNIAHQSIIGRPAELRIRPQEAGRAVGRCGTFRHVTRRSGRKYGSAPHPDRDGDRSCR